MDMGGAPMPDGIRRLIVGVRVAYARGDEYGGFQPPARLSLARYAACGAPMPDGIRRASDVPRNVFALCALPIIYKYI